MKVLLVFPQRDRQTGLFIKRAFEQLGCELKVVDAKAEPKNMVPAAKQFGPDMVFCSRTPALLGGMQILKREHPEITTVCWNVDVRASAERFGRALLDLFNSVDLYYCKPEGMVADFQRLCPRTKVQSLLEAIDPELHKR